MESIENFKENEDVFLVAKDTIKVIIIIVEKINVFYHYKSIKKYITFSYTYLPD